MARYYVIHHEDGGNVMTVSVADNGTHIVDGTGPNGSFGGCGRVEGWNFHQKHKHCEVSPREYLVMRNRILNGR